MHSDGQTVLRRIGPAANTVPSPIVDVVFVHGLGGDDSSTWTPDGVTESLLNWLTADIPEIAVWSLRHPAGATKWTTDGEGMALPDRAANLIPTMLYYGIGSRSTIFVCHSLGGLVVKQILRHSSEMAVPEWQVIAGSTLGVAFPCHPPCGVESRHLYQSSETFAPHQDSAGAEGTLSASQRAGRLVPAERNATWH